MTSPVSAATSRASLRHDGILSSEDIARLKAHKYACEGLSVLDPYMNVFWNWVTSKFPLWLAPNTITLAGMFCVVASALVLVAYSPLASISEEVPSWAFALHAICIFAYQTLDGCDGKQARRTGSATPLGELFDHGCDSVSTAFFLVALVVSLSLGDTNVAFAVSMAGLGTFYLAQWQTYVTGVLKFASMDVTEAQWVSILAHSTTAIFGRQVWTTEIAFGYQANHVFVYSMLLLAMINITRNISAILEGGPGRAGTTPANTSVLSPMIPLIFFFLTASYMRHSCFDKAPCLFVVAVGLVISKLANKLIVAHMVKAPIEQLDITFAPALIFYINVQLGNLVDPMYIFYLSCIFWAYSLVAYCVGVCTEICNALGIHCFRIPVPEEKKDSKKAN